MILIIWCVSLAVIFLGFTLFIVLTKKKAFAKVKNIIPGSLLYNIEKGILLEYILPDKGSPFNDRLHNETFNCFINSELGKMAIKIAEEDCSDE